MKTTGIVRRIDDLGRVVIPKEIRRTFKLRGGDPLEICISEDGIVLAKYDPTPSIEEEAQNWLHNMKNTMDEQEVKFFIDGDMTTCIGKKNGRQVCNTAICCENDPFSYAVGMVQAYCKAFEIESPLTDF